MDAAQVAGKPAIGKAADGAIAARAPALQRLCGLRRSSAASLISDSANRSAGDE
jgi:hypothetical protein